MRRCASRGVYDRGKSAGDPPLSCLAQAVLAEEAGFPKGAINVITTLDSVSDVGQALCSNKMVRKLGFTGTWWKQSFIVFDDASIDTAIQACIMAKFRNSGQTCVTANRIFVQKGIYEKFTNALIDKVRALKVGSGIEDGVHVGPLTHERAVGKAMDHIEDARKHGAEVVLGGAPLETLPGYFLQPTIIKDMNASMKMTCEETFAPVVGLYKFETEEEAIQRANDCDVGLGGFICTENISRMWRVAEALEVGMVGVNLGMLSACESPFGGIKESGYGRELGHYGIDEYLAVKSMIGVGV
ncbi:hypothetical protein N7532_008447 [Penicillium argentinense]|uniref:Succinate-semialdehyde dehydrogenase, mitochondrial n=1 Tax=Penicillium argentinense TaxID=1131581 RepID=A0A9W9EXC3_9EURO|nr:uncharacterized protein N7532_008447 [Penicillium argentinense]KAJ5089763.1 hypothetical protein N7532_008447 [Penicillium argentinense]